jgi:soluble epoxide hydrolase / lipid-phosphate phosphatase
MDRLEHKTLTTSRSLEYTYYSTPTTPASSQLPALLFCHGFPDSSFLWDDVLALLQDLPHKMIAPDMLGYAGTAKPMDPALYNCSGISDDLMDIVDAENVDKVVVVGHDWGAAAAQRLYPFYPDRVVGIVLLNISYRPPTKPGDPRFNLQEVNKLLETTFGAPLWTYWEFFTAEDGPRLLRENLERVYEAQHGDVPDWKFKLFCVPNAWREYVTGDKSVPLMPYAQQQKWKDSFFKQWEKDGFEAPVNWYKAMINNHQYEVEVKIPLDRHIIKAPVLFVGCTQDANNRIDIIERPKAAGLLPDLEVKVLECAHWSPMEKPQEVAGFIREFVTERI